MVPVVGVLGSILFRLRTLREKKSPPALSIASPFGDNSALAWESHLRLQEQRLALKAVVKILQDEELTDSAQDAWVHEFAAYRLYVDRRLRELGFQVPCKLLQKILEADKKARARDCYSAALAVYLADIIERTALDEFDPIGT